MIKKSRKLVKGMPSAVGLSILIHAALFLLAGMLVVFTVVKKEEKKFVPPKAVERPKMKLRKPKVKVKKTSKPKPSTRIVTKVPRASLPDIQLPEMSGMSEGLVGGLGGFDIMPDLGEESLFGSGQSIGNDFEGTFYDLKRDRRGRPIPSSPEKYLQDVKEFVRSGWKSSEFARYYRSPKKLYATHFMIPVVPSVLGPEVFDENTGGWLWLAHYKGELVHKDGITFRFRGSGDDLMIVRVDGELVLNGSIDQGATTPHWQTPEPTEYGKYWLGSTGSVVGDWITLEPGVPLDMEVLIGESRGDFFCAMLLVEVKGVKYERVGRLMAPDLPMFTTTEITRDQLEAIHANLVPGEAGVTNGPIFRDYELPAVAIVTNDTGAGDPPVTDLPLYDTAEDKMRMWAGVDGKFMEAKFVAVIGDKVVLKDARGKQRKIPLAQLSDEDRLFTELARPPKFNIDFSKKSSQRSIDKGPYNHGGIIWLEKVCDFVFTTKLRQRSAGKYNHELKVEFFAIGEEIDGDNYILLDRQTSRFTPTKENGQSHSFHGVPVALHVRDWSQISMYRGQKYGGYLVVVTDSRGKVVDVGSSHKWLPGLLSKLREFPVSRHFDKTGARVAPPRPIIWY